MSYNRGNSGRRSSDFGVGNRRGGGSYRSHYGSYSSMNPWEGGMVPGRGSNLLPTPGQGNLLSQLTSPEAQLALASNLINKLITQQQPGPTSLLNLGNMSSSGGHMSSYNDGYGNTRNFQDRRRGRMDQRRTEPYKSGMNRRMGPDRRNLGKNRMGSDRKTSLVKSPKSQKEDKDKKDKDAEKTNGDVKTESGDDSKREDGKVREEEDSSDEGEKKNKEPIPAALLYCHVCSKNMWDEISFNKHMKGRPHQLMMDGMNEKYKLKVNLLRHEMRLAEQQREMELERKQRQGMKMYNHPREYCAMCDLHFYGNLISHRKNVRHQKLKQFLHPKCSHCDKEFSTRLEWDDHRLTFSHLNKVADFRRATKPHIKDDEFDIDELVCPDIVNCGEMVAKEIPVITRHQSEEDVSIELKEELTKDKDVKKEPKDGEEEKADDKGEESKEEKDKEPEAPQGIDVDPSKLPKYNPLVIIGKDLVKPVSGFVCQVCNRFLQGEEEAQIHCRTLSHHTNYCNIVRAKARISGRRKRGQSKSKDGEDDTEKSIEEKNQEDKLDDTVGSSTLDNPKDDEGNWKRRPISNDESEMEVEEPKTEEVKEDVTDTWEEGDKENTQDSEAMNDENTEDQEEELVESPSTKRQRETRATATRGKRGGKRGK